MLASDKQSSLLLMTQISSEERQKQVKDEDIYYQHIWTIKTSSSSDSNEKASF